MTIEDLRRAAIRQHNNARRARIATRVCVVVATIAATYWLLDVHNLI